MFQRIVGGAEGTRTPDPLHAMQVRYQLRHSPKPIDPALIGPKQLVQFRQFSCPRKIGATASIQPSSGDDGMDASPTLCSVNCHLSGTADDDGFSSSRTDQ